MPRYKCKNIAALDIALSGLPPKIRVEADAGTGVSAKTVGELRKVTAWSENLVITTPQERHPESTVKSARLPQRLASRRNGRSRYQSTWLREPRKRSGSVCHQGYFWSCILVALHESAFWGDRKNILVAMRFSQLPRQFATKRCRWRELLTWLCPVE
jgi:hypothetical protein